MRPRYGRMVANCLAEASGRPGRAGNRPDVDPAHCFSNATVMSSSTSSPTIGMKPPRFHSERLIVVSPPKPTVARWLNGLVPEPRDLAAGGARLGTPLGVR